LVKIIKKCSIHTIYTWKENSSKAEVSHHTCRDFQTEVITPAGISRQQLSHLPGFPDRRYHTCRDFQTDVITPAGISRQTLSHLPGFPDRRYHTYRDFQPEVITPARIFSLILICTTHWALKLGENF